VSYHWLIPLGAAAADLLICAAVARNALREPRARVFTLLALLASAWNLDLFCLDYFRNAADAEWWSRIFRCGMLLAPPVALHTATRVFEYDHPVWRRLVAAGYAAASLLVAANIAGLLVHGLARHTWGWYPLPTRLYGLFSVLFAVYTLPAAWLVWRRFRRPSSPRQRVQARFVVFATFAALPLVATNFLALHGVPIYPLGSLGNVFYMGIIAYAMARHRLMDLDYVVRKGLSFTLAAAPVLVPGGFGFALLGRGFGARAPSMLACLAVAMALVAALVVPTLQRALETRLYRALFPERYGSRRRLRELAESLVHVLDKNELVQRLAESLVDILDVERCEVFLPDERGRRLACVYASAPGVEPLPEEAFGWLEPVAEPILASEAEVTGSPAASLFRERAWELGIPLRINERLVGFLALGRNRDFRIFSAEDLLLLATVAASASVALDNARLSRQLRRSETVLERANRLSSLGQLAAGIAHEIRNPLVAVKTFLDLLPERLDDRDFLVRFRDLSLSELGRVTHLIQDLLSFGRSTRTERRLVTVPDTLEPVVRLMETSARKRQVELTSRFDPELPPVLADPDQLKQIVLNLLLNAIEVSPEEGHVHLDVRAAQEFAGAGRSVVIEVHDEGPGIPKEHQEDIFLPFFTTKETGTGLGLALVHQMVLEHGGDISVESEPGQRTTFRVTLPEARPPSASSPPALAPTGT
jgi:signal transduction histidine kinase